MIELKKITHVFNPATINENIVLRDFELTINDGDYITVIGSNGAGKTTLYNIISGTYTPTYGNIYINGKRITKLPEYKRASFIGRIYQNPLLGTAGSMSIEQNMTLCSKKGFRGLSKSLNSKSRALFMDQLKTLDMGLENRLKDRVGLLSGGQRQALTLLTTVMSRPELLLLDEHTAALDPGNAEAVMKLTKRFINEYNMTALMITHNMQQAIDYGNRLIMMDKGKVILDIAGEEKQSLTVPKLIKMFRELKSELMDTDEILLDETVE